MQPSGRTPLSTEVSWFVGVLLYGVVAFGGLILFFSHRVRVA